MAKNLSNLGRDLEIQIHEANVMLICSVVSDSLKLCVSSRSWWWTGKPGILQSMESQRLRQNWATELNVLPSTRKGNESETALVSFTWLKGKDMFDLNEPEHQVFQGQENQLNVLQLAFFKKVFIHLCSLQCYSQQPRDGSNPSVHYRWMDKRNVFIHTMEYYSALKGWKFWHGLQHGWTLMFVK